MKSVPLSEVKNDLSRFLRLAEKEEIVITRHEAAASITATSQAVALCISQSTGTVSVFKGGRLITDIPKPWGRAAVSL